jgi:hypothetical protein
MDKYSKEVTDDRDPDVNEKICSSESIGMLKVD